MVVRALLFEHEALESFQKQLKKAKMFSIAASLMTAGGIENITAGLTHSLKRGGRGRVLFGVDMPTDPQAIVALTAIQAQFPKQFIVKRYGASDRFFHPKFAVFADSAGNRTAVIGSSNITVGGFGDNREANILIASDVAIRDLLSYFDDLFNGAYGFTIKESWLANYLLLWNERAENRREFEKLRRKVRQIPSKRSKVPPRIKGFQFCFTGRIKDWPRERVLYPWVKRFGGKIGRKLEGVKSSDCLIQGEILGDRETTRKLQLAITHGVVRISEEEFFRIADTEKRLRKNKRAHRSAGTSV